MDDYKHQSYRMDDHNIEIIHGWSGDSTPPEHSIKYAKEANCLCT